MPWTVQDAQRHTLGYVPDARQWDDFAAMLGVPQACWPNPLPVVHFVRFVDGDQHFQNAVRVFGPPAFMHKVWDKRAQQDIAPWDTVVFGKGDPDQPITPWSYDDSNQPDDPAYWDRLNAV